jgi:hypothetical protein
LVRYAFSSSGLLESLIDRQNSSSTSEAGLVVAAGVFDATAAAAPASARVRFVSLSPPNKRSLCLGHLDRGRSWTVIYSIAKASMSAW